MARGDAEFAEFAGASFHRPLREDAHDRLPEHPGPRDLAGDVTDQRWLLTALAGLADRERAVVVLRHYFDLSEKDVAAELGIAVGTVKSLNARALAKLRVTLTPADFVANGAL